MLQDLTTLDALDFLPPEYRQKGSQRRALAWRVVVAAAFGVFFCSTAIFLHNHQTQMNSRLAEIEAQYALAVTHNAQGAEITAKLRAERASAELLTYLRHRWPCTQVTAAVMESLPDSITLTEWQISHEIVHHPGIGNTVPPDPKTAPWDKPSRQTRDLERLLHETTGQQHFILITGYATEASALHEYLAHLGTHPLFAKIELRSIENHPADLQATRQRGAHHFSAKAILRARHGQAIPNGPAAPGAAPTSGPLAQRGTTHE